MLTRLLTEAGAVTINLGAEVDAPDLAQAALDNRAELVLISTHNSLGQGVIAIAFNPWVTSSQQSDIKEFFEIMGSAIVVEERWINPITALSSPATVYAVLRWLIDSGSVFQREVRDSPLESKSLGPHGRVWQNRGMSVRYAIGSWLFTSSLAVCVVGCMFGGDTFPDDPECTEIGCDDSLMVTIEPSDDEPFPDGEYRFSLVPPSGQGLAVSCALLELQLECTGGADILTVELNEIATRFTLRLRADWWLNGLNARVELDGQALADRPLEITSQVVTPNGPECEPTCFQGSAELVLD